MTEAPAETVLVTGATGFVGRALVKKLREEGYRVKALVRREDPDLRAHGAELVFADLARGLDRDAVAHFSGVDTIFHTAAKVEMWGKREDFVAVNINGTRSILEAARRSGVRRLVFTSSPSVIADGHDLRGIDESYPYPLRYDAYYPETKAVAEREVLASHTDSLRTVALRPHLIWGPGDTNLVPTILERARAGRLVRVGDGSNRVDLCFIDDCVAAHLAAMNALREKPQAGGRAYFISQGEPVLLWEWIDRLLLIHGLPRVHRRLPTGVALGAAWTLEAFARLTGKEPLITRFLVHEMATDHFFSIAAAERELDFVPRYSIDQAMTLTFGERQSDLA